MSIGDTLDEPVEVDRTFVGDARSGLESRRSVQVVKKRPQVLRLFDARSDGVRIERVPGIDSLLQRDEVTLQDAQWQHHVVRGVRNVVP